MPLETLDNIQKAAVMSTAETVLCDSKAGSGKTRVLMNRCVWLMEHGVKPEEIMLVTFTNKAAKEMMERIQKLSPDGDKILCGTFHFIAMKYIREYADAIGYRKDFTILSPDDCVKKMKDIFKTYDLLYPDDEIMGKEKLKPAYLVRAFSRSRNLGIELREVLLGDELTYGDTDKGEVLVKMYNKYRRSSNVLDFDDLLDGFYKLLKNPVTGDEIRSRFKHIMVDEYQDINQVQNGIIRSLYNYERNLFVVGDPYQCIYGFRGSKIEYITDFDGNYVADVFHVVNNYRSTQSILNVANSVTGGKTPMKSQVPDGPKPVLKFTTDNQAQAEIAANQVKAFIKSGVDPKQIAILVRSTNEIYRLEKELTRLNIDYVMRAGFSYFEKAHIKDILMLLTTIVNPLNKDAWKRCMGLFDGLGAKTVDKCVDYMLANSITSPTGLCNAIKAKKLKVTAKAETGLQNFRAAFEMVKKQKDIPMMIKIFCDVFYKAYVINIYSDDYEERLGDIEHLKELGKGYTDVQKFVNESIVDTSINNKETGDKKDKIVVSTIHRAKGLEWDNVIILNMDSPFGGFSVETDEEEFDVPEDVRLMYVAITRARQKLLILGNSSFRSGKTRASLSHLLPKLAPACNVYH